MAKRIGAAILAATLTFGGSVAGNAASAVPSQTVMQKPQTGPTDLSARLRIQHHHRAIHRQIYRPYYYDRPVYYAPAPFFPFLGLGYGPWW